MRRNAALLEELDAVAGGTCWVRVLSSRRGKDLKRAWPACRQLRSARRNSSTGCRMSDVCASNVLHSLGKKVNPSYCRVYSLSPRFLRAERGESAAFYSSIYTDSRLFIISSRVLYIIILADTCQIQSCSTISNSRGSTALAPATRHPTAAAVPRLLPGRRRAPTPRPVPVRKVALMRW